MRARINAPDVKVGYPGVTRALDFLLANLPRCEFEASRSTAAVSCRRFHD
jgi:hypothetical protein